MINIARPKSEKIKKEICKLVSSAMYPINGGPIKNPRKLMLDTIAKAIPAGMVGCFPAKLYTVGTQHATPSPTNIKPMVAHNTVGKRTDSIIPANIKIPLVARTFLFPNLMMRKSPTKRPVAIIIINAV